MKLFLVMGAGLCLATGFANADTTEVNSDNASEFNSKISFGAMEERVQLDSESAWYIVPNGGINMIDDVTLDGEKITFDSGYSVGIGIGVDMSNNFRIQLDIGYMDNDIDDLTIIEDGVPITFSGNVEQLPIMLSGIFDIGNSKQVRPYLGVGLGTTRTEGNFKASVLGFDIASFNSKSSWEFSYQLLAGVSFEMSPTSNLVVGYRFLHVDDGFDDADLDNHTISLGLNFHF